MQPNDGSLDQSGDHIHNSMDEDNQFQDFIDALTALR